MRVRITFAKQGALRYTGHLDLHKLMERAARRAELPLSYSQGFHPQPKISLAAALPLGFASRDEVMDIRLNEDLEPDDISTRLKNSLPTGIQILKVERVEDGLPPLQTQLLSATYEAHLMEPADGADLTRKVEALMMSESLPRERRGKSYDLRPLIEMLSVVTESNGKIWLRMTLAAREGATGRPDEVLTALGIEPETVRVERTKLIFIK
jgi:radical SAM-linked protein